MLVIGNCFASEGGGKIIQCLHMSQRTRRVTGHNRFAAVLEPFAELLEVVRRKPVEALFAVMNRVFFFPVIDVFHRAVRETGNDGCNGVLQKRNELCKICNRE